MLGAVRDALTYAWTQVSVELNAATDNPLILVDDPGVDKAFSAGLFHGEPVGFAADHAKLALCELAALSERRTYRLTTGHLSARLPPLLADGPGLGLMMPQVSATGLVAENRRLAMPSSVDSLPTCEDQEDHVAMSTTAARRASEVLRNAEWIVAIELLGAAKGIWVRGTEGPVTLGEGTAPALKAVEAALGGPRTGIPADDLAALVGAIRSGAILDAVESVMGPLASVASGARHG